MHHPHSVSNPDPYAGKSSLAQQLASRLNLPNVLQTDVLYEVCGWLPGQLAK